jgi:hypothetical protein
MHTLDLKKILFVISAENLLQPSERRARVAEQEPARPSEQASYAVTNATRSGSHWRDAFFFCRTGMVTEMLQGQ